MYGINTIITTFAATLVLCSFGTSVPVSSKYNNDNTCGYQSCHPTKEDHINIHLVPHSHDDVGWVKTVDQYYFGVPVLYYEGAVQYIYSSVLNSLKRHKDRKFIHVETAFFWRWWKEQDEQTKSEFTQMVNTGQIEFIGGGWSMNDEAVTNYQSIIDMMTWGLRKLNDTFGECGRPKIGWQIDPFGHSNEMASIFAHLGYDGLFLGRIDIEDKYTRFHNKTMEMVWRGSHSLGRESDIFTSILFDNYNAPERFCFEESCHNDPLVDDPNSPEYNIDKRVSFFLEHYVHFARQPYHTSNILVTMGQDFSYKNAELWYINMDKLIKFTKGKVFNGKKYNIMYSTPSCYTYAVYKETKGIITSNLKTDDFFPYGSDKHSYWTGYYTSRPTLKRFERSGNNFLQICKQLSAMTNIYSDYESQLDNLREVMGVMQHHDAITGTEKEVVAYDYAKQLTSGIVNCENVTNKALSKLINEKHPRFNQCLLTNVSQCIHTEKYEKFVVTVYNPLSRPVDKYVRLPVPQHSYSVRDPSGNHVRTQLIPIHSKVLKIPGRDSQATQELIFKAASIPPLGFKSYYVEWQPTRNDITPMENSTFCVHYDKVGFDVDPKHGFVGKLIFATNNVSVNIHQTFQYYCGAIDITRPSGAYVFRRDPNIPLQNVVDKVTSNKIYMGPLVTEVHQVYGDMVSQTVRVYEDEKFIEFDWVVGPLPNFKMNGLEVISKFITDLKTKSTFYTDSNGREMLKRVRNFRPTWNVTLAEPDSGNYYPVTSKIVLKDEENNIQFAVLTDRAQGGSSLADGVIELMVHRNTAMDDRFGVDEKLNEYAYNTGVVARGSHYVIAGHINPNTEQEENIVAVERDIAEKKLLDSWIFISKPNQNTFEAYQRENNMEFYGLQTYLPSNVHIMTLEPWKDSTFLLRLEHTFAKDEDKELSQPVIINLKELFSTFQITSVKETTLGGNQWLKDNKRFDFKSIQQLENEDVEIGMKSSSELEIELVPMQIRTFIIEVVPTAYFT